MSRISTALQFIRHRYHAKRWDAFHSPYLFQLFSYCCEERNQFPLFAKIEKHRALLIKSNEIISFTDFGAGSTIHENTRNVAISSIARHALSFPFQCRFLSRLAHLTHPSTILEFGTSLGISTAYLATGAPGSKILTVEGDPEIASRAQHLFEVLELKHIHQVTSTFDEFISSSLSSLAAIDLLFIDGHHHSDALIHYYQSLASHFHDDTIIIVDDIHWSVDMYEGWLYLADLPEVTQTVDCFHFGLLLFSKSFLNKEDHLIRLPISSYFK